MGNGVIEKLRTFVDSEKWTFAKTYANKAPHYYIVRGKINGDDEEFMWAAEYIQCSGAPMHYWGHLNHYIYLDGWWYWVMKDGDDDPTMIINRCWADDYYVSTRWKGNKD